MSLPTLTLTWQRAFNIQNALTGTAQTEYDGQFIKIKDALKTFAQNPWTVVGSSNGSSSNMSGTDLLTSTSNIVHAAAGVAHSWIVMQQPGTGVQVCWDFSSATVTTMTVTWSPTGGYSGGSTTARPTATDQQTILSNTVWQGGASYTGQFVTHIIHDTTGICTRIFNCHSGECRSWFSFESPSETPTGWTSPYCALFAGVTAANDPTILTDALILNGTARYLAKGTAAATMPMYITGMYAIGGDIISRLDYPNEYSRTVTGDSYYPVMPCGLWHDATSGQKGRHGRLRDFYLTIPALLTGDSMPEDASKTFTVLGDMLIPTAGEDLVFG